MNLKSVEISNELGQILPGVQIYPNFAKNSEFESRAGRSKGISSKVDFNVLRDPSIPLDLINYREIIASSTLSFKSCVLYHYLEIITNYDHLSKE